MTQDAPAMVACAHGTRSATGRRTMARLRLDVATLRPGLRVVPACVDVQKPALLDVVRRLTGTGQPCVVVPLLLAAGITSASTSPRRSRRGTDWRSAPRPSDPTRR